MSTPSSRRIRPAEVPPRRRRAWSYLGSLLLALSAIAAPAQTPLRFGVAQPPITLDPRHATDAASERICRLIYRALVGFDDRYRPVPQLAHWERLSPTHYRFTLGSEGREFHDGTRLTAADVKRTYDYVLDAANASPHRAALESIARVDAPDPEHVDFHLSRPDALFPGRLTMGIVPAWAAAGVSLARRPVGSGPYRLADWPEAGTLSLRRVADGAPLQFVAVQNPTVRALKLVSGEIDLLQGDMPPELLSWLRDRPGMTVRRVPGDSVSYLGFSLAEGATRDLRVRRAIAHAIDRAAILAYVFGGSGRLASSVLRPGHWAGAAGLPALAYDPQRSRELLSAAGYGESRPLRITYKTSSDPYRVRIATILQGQLRQVGIEVDLRSYDWGTFYGDIKAGRFQMYSLSWVGLNLPDIFRYAFHSSSLPPAGANRGRYRDPITDRLIESAEAEPRPQRQAELYGQVQQRLLDALPIVPLWSEDVTVVMRAGVSDYEPATDGNYDSLAHARW
ncbi:MAG: ABC transporter substrate-binding protein [Gammaproteobacteria bacterium]|nr:ABC transporter substrate-binding protein [Gammaproteobacteria bacterium]